MNDKELYQLLSKLKNEKNLNKRVELKEPIIEAFFDELKEYCKANYPISEVDDLHMEAIAFLNDIYLETYDDKTDFKEGLYSGVKSYLDNYIDSYKEFKKEGIELANTLNKILEIEKKNSFGFKPNPEMVASELGISLDELNEYKLYACDTLNVERKYYDFSKYSLTEIVESVSKTTKIPDEEETENEYDFDLDSLSDTEQDIVILSFGLYGNPKIEKEDLAIKYNCSTERIDQVLRHALSKIKKDMEG